ncbi:alanine racemase [Sinomonas sp. ASV322]|uniref:alanine racemase n=1 Tax=Sinomonas sp. ASV322 TaxID=3041920 RepID=UPI0027DBE66F|nr:alanine racemase [Sinomonas sp. ASV322]MDQ4501722.1 alanine racemase [Sinomonas sp. ASV322]
MTTSPTTAGPTASGPTPIDARAVAALGSEVLDWRHKSVPAAFHGQTAAAFAASREPLGALQTPLLTLDSSALEGNLARFARWCREHGVLVAPHGKTTMSPQLWARQLELGAWGITLANAAQLRVARHFGVQRLMLANSLTDPQAIRWAAGEVRAGAEIISWVDSTRTVELLESVLADASPAARTVLDVVVELGGASGRTGARTAEEALDVARAAAAAPHLRVVGVGGYEGALAHTADDAGLAAVRAYLASVRSLHEKLLAEGLYGSDSVIVTAGGSAYFDDVVEILAPCSTAGDGGAGDGGAHHRAAPRVDVADSLATDGGAHHRAAPRVDVVLRSGAYLIHDDGFYRGISPFSRTDPDAETAFHSAMHAWARVVSQPEPGLAILDAGKRDLSVDEGLPVPQLIGAGLGTAMRTLDGAWITAVNDQHAFMSFDPAESVRPGDVVRLGLSHPCTALDKWTLIPVIDSAASPQDAVVVGTVRTFF